MVGDTDGESTATHKYLRTGQQLEGPCYVTNSIIIYHYLRGHEDSRFRENTNIYSQEGLKQSYNG